MGAYHQATAVYSSTVTREDLLRVVEELGLMPEDEDTDDYGQDELAELVAKRFKPEYVVVDYTHIISL